MAMIFPGMDPYLEDPRGWASLHSRLVVYIADVLQPLLRPRYLTTVEQRVFLAGPDRDVIPDVRVRWDRPDSPGGVTLLDADAPVVVEVEPLEVRETYVEVRDRQSGQRVVTVIEVVSPTNKYQGPGRESYTQKQQEVLGSAAHLVEIDLLRHGPHVLAVPEHAARRRVTYDYLCCVNRTAGRRGRYELYPRRLPERLPRLRIPLGEGDPDVSLDVQAVIAQAYEAGAYREVLDYSTPCRPPLSAEDQAWADERIRAASQAPPAP